MADKQCMGLSSAEVEQRVSQGKTNVNTDVKTKSLSRIFLEHICTLFNAVNFVLGVLIAITGEYRNLYFFVIVLANLVIGITQEIRAKQLVDKLTILTVKKVAVCRDGAVQEILPAELVLDDVICLAHGDQIPADSEVIEGSAQLDESLLTGESKAVVKTLGDELLSGSFIVTGSLKARIIRVGADGYAAKINAEAKVVKIARSEISETLRAIIRLGTYMLVPLGVGLFLRTFLLDTQNWEHALLTSVAAVLGMIPQGLVLLTSTVLAVATMRLGRKSVLIQQANCIETLARMDTLCLDKTGTITSGAMEVSQLVSAEKNAEHGRNDELEVALQAIIAANKSDLNETSSAIARYLREQTAAQQMHTVQLDATGMNIEQKSANQPSATRIIQNTDADTHVARTIHFSSERKYSGVVTNNKDAYVMGAPSYILSQDQLEAAYALGTFDPMERILAIAAVEGFDEQENLLGTPQLLGMIALRDEIRPTAPKTIAYFKEQGVRLRIISGDDPKTVSAIAVRVGVPNADCYVDASTLSDNELDDAIERYSVFGRVTPYQKRNLVRAYHKKRAIVGMTGDGVNDVLALREADCSVCMASGSAAARNVSEIVLADNKFSHMPEVVAEGRRSINNLQRSASLFLVKTVFAALLSAVCIVLPPYPFIPIQMSLFSFCIIGLPSFVLALEPNHDLVTGKFLVNVLVRSLPASIMITIALLCARISGLLLKLPHGTTSTMCLVLSLVIGLALIIRISQPLNALRSSLVGLIVLMLFLGLTVFSKFFRIAPLNLQEILIVGIFSIVIIFGFNLLYDAFSKRSAHSQSFMRIVDNIYRR